MIGEGDRRRHGRRGGAQRLEQRIGLRGGGVDGVEPLGGEHRREAGEDLPDQRGARSEQHVVGGNPDDRIFTDPCQGPAAAIRHVPPPPAIGDVGCPKDGPVAGAVKVPGAIGKPRSQREIETFPTSRYPT